MGWLWWRAMSCKRKHGVVVVLGSQAGHVRGMCWESGGTAGRSQVVMGLLVCATLPRGG